MSKSKYTRGLDPFSRRWWLSRLHNAFWVTVVTLLVWIYADLEHLGEEEMETTIRLTTGEAPDLQLLSSDEITLSFKVRGNRMLLDRLKRRLVTRRAALVYDVSRQFAKPGDYNVAAEDILQQAIGADQSGIIVLSTSVDSVRMRLDRVLRVPVPVRFDHIGATLDGPPRINPPEVIVRVAQSTWTDILTRPAQPILLTVQTDVTTARTGQKVGIVPMIAGVHVQPEIEDVIVEFSILQLTDKEVISVQVLVTDPAAWHEDDTWTRYVLERKDPAEWLAQITVSGPRKDLDQLLSRKLEVAAYVRLTDDDKKPVSSWLLPRKVLIQFPADLDVKLVGAPPTVQFKLVERSTAPPAS